MGDLSDLLHSLFVLLTTFSYALPMWEGIQRRSVHHTLLFASQGVLSFVLHCQETGLCAPLKAKVHASLTSLSATLVYYLLFIMLGVVFEIRSETLLRLVGLVTSAGMYALDPSATSRNVAAVACLCLLVLVADVAMSPRQFTEKYWKRLVVIAGMAGLGLLLLRLLSVLWVWHGVWHVYFIGATYLLLLAQRVKKTQQAKRPNGGAAGGRGSASSSGTAQGSSTPVKRRGPGPGRLEGAAALPMEGSSGEEGGGMLGRTDDGGRTAVV